MKTDILRTERITPVGIVLFLLSFCVMVIMAMTASWAHGVDTRETSMEGRESTLEQNYGTVSGQLQDLRELRKKSPRNLTSFS